MTRIAKSSQTTVNVIGVLSLALSVASCGPGGGEGEARGQGPLFDGRLEEAGAMSAFLRTPVGEGWIDAIAPSEGGGLYAYVSSARAISTIHPDGVVESNIELDPKDFPTASSVVSLAAVGDSMVVLLEGLNDRVHVVSNAGGLYSSFSVNSLEARGQQSLAAGAAGTIVVPEAEGAGVRINLYDLAGRRVADGAMLGPGEFSSCPRTWLQDGSGASFVVPYSPTFSWLPTPDGGAVVGCSRLGHLTKLTAQGGRVPFGHLPSPRIPISGLERQDLLAALNERMSKHGFTGEWDSAHLPYEKPFFYQLLRGPGGTVWVFVPRPSTREDGNSGPVGTGRSWVEPLALVVFDSSGVHVRTVKGPPELRTSLLPPVITSDGLWAVLASPDGGSRLVFYRLVPD